MSFANKLESSDRLKHITLKMLFVKKLVEQKRIILQYVPTEDMIADLFTKFVAIATFERLSQMLMGSTV